MAVTVTPRASKNGLEQLTDGTLRVRLTAPPVDGAANAALLRFLADVLDIPRSRLTIVSGESNRRKRVVVEGLSASDVEARVKRALHRSG